VKEYQAYFLNHITAPGIDKEYRLTKSDMPGITLADVNSLAKAYITNTNRDILILAPEKDKSSLPNEAKVNSWLKAVEAEALSPYNDEVSSQALLSTMPTPGKIKSEEQNKQLNITSITLSNGIKILLKPTDFKTTRSSSMVLPPGVPRYIAMPITSRQPTRQVLLLQMAQAITTPAN
jgi:zinc protease